MRPRQCAPFKPGKIRNESCSGLPHGRPVRWHVNPDLVSGELSTAHQSRYQCFAHATVLMDDENLSEAGAEIAISICYVQNA